MVENAIQIKRSSGIPRGKQDKIDAHRIALHAFRNADTVKPGASSEILEQIINLDWLRDRITEVSGTANTCTDPEINSGQAE